MASMTTSSALNLASVDAPERAAAWMRAAGTLFPGLSVNRLPVNPTGGAIHGIPLGSGSLWSIMSPQVLARYQPTLRTEPQPMFSVMVQLEGSTVSRQSGRECRLADGDFCVLDGLVPSRTALAFSGEDPGAVLLRNVLLNIHEAAPFLDSDQRSAVLATAVQMMATPKLPGADASTCRASQRIAATLAFIDTELADPTLTAQRVAYAQGLSRRRLDEILLRSVGTSLSAQIWARRLGQAASDLLNPRFARKTVTQIAFGVGFEDAAHFARAFKRRYLCTPREWRTRMEDPVSLRERH